jgi:predicted RNase H-like HicB family nuclease
MTSYAVQFATRYDGLVIASFPDLPGVTALGRDDEEALAEAQRALADALDAYAREGRTPPQPSARGAATVSVELARPPLPA